MASIVEFDSDMQRGIMFVLSNQTTEGKSGIVIHFFKFFNILQWDYSIDLIQRLPWLNGNFKLKSVDSLSNYAPGKLAVLTSDP